MKQLSFEKIKEKLKYLDRGTNQKELTDFLFQNPLPCTTEPNNFPSLTILGVLKKLDSLELFKILTLKHPSTTEGYFFHRIATVGDDQTNKAVIKLLEKKGQFNAFNLLTLKNKTLHIPLHYIAECQGPLANQQWVSFFSKFLKKVDPQVILNVLNTQSFGLNSVLWRFFRKQDDEINQAMLSLLSNLLERGAKPKNVLATFISKNMHGSTPAHLITFLKNEETNRQWFLLLIKLLEKGVSDNDIVNVLKLETETGTTPFYLMAGRRELSSIIGLYLLFFELLLKNVVSFKEFFSVFYMPGHKTNPSLLYFAAKEQTLIVNEKLLMFLEYIFSELKTEEDILFFIKILGIEITTDTDHLTYFNASKHRVNEDPGFRLHEQEKTEFAKIVIETVIHNWLNDHNKQEILIFLNALLRSGIQGARHHINKLNEQNRVYTKTVHHWFSKGIEEDSEPPSVVKKRKTEMRFSIGNLLNGQEEEKPRMSHSTLSKN